MTEPSPGEAAIPAGWERRRVGEPPLSVLVSEPVEGAAPSDGDRGERSRRAIRDRAALGTGSAGEPVCSVTLVLERQPTPDDDTIRPLIERATLRFDATLAVTDRALRAIGCETGDDVDALYATETEFSLVARADDDDGAERVLDTVTVTGTNPRASLGATLDRDDALAVLGALSGGESHLAVDAVVRYRPPAASRTLSLRGSWTEIYDVLADREPATGDYDRDAVRAAVMTMVERGVLAVETAGATGSIAGAGPAESDVGTAGPVLEAAVDLFADRAGLVLRRVGDGSTGDAAPTYALGARPPAGTSLRVTESVDLAAERTIRSCAPLATLLGDGLAGDDIDAFVSAVALGGGEIDGVGPVLERVETGSRRAARSGDRSTTLAIDGSSLRSVGRLLAPSDRTTRRPTGSIVADPSPHPVPDPAPQPQGDVAVQPTDQRRHLPVMDKTVPTMGMWPDRIDDDREWYAPAFEPVEPSGAGEAGSFRFEFERHGTTADGEPGLRGTLTFDLERAIPAGISPTASRYDPVPLSDLSVDVTVPYEIEDGGTRTHRLSAEVSRDGDTVTATVDLQNRWVRLCYGALALPDFQESQPEVEISYAFEGYVKRLGIPVGGLDSIGQEAAATIDETAETPGDPDVDPRIVGLKEAVTPVVAGGRSAARRAVTEPIFDPETGTLATSLGTLDVSGERRGGDDRADSDARDEPEREISRTRRAGIVPLEPPAASGRSGSGERSAAGVGRDTAVRPTSAAVLASDVAVRPSLQDGDMTIQPVPTYTLETFDESVRRPLAYPCAEHGTRYRERTDDGTRAIGCREPFALGEASGSQYEELDALRHDRYRVYRALAQPHRYLVVPTRYRIGRREPGSSRAYQPTAIVYAVLEPDAPRDSRVVFEAGMQPELPRYERLALEERLRERRREGDPDPVLEHPTDVFADATYEWAIDDAFDPPTVVEHADHLRVSATVDVVDAHLLRRMLETNGLFGRASFELPDGTTVASDLALELSSMTGPWDRGPLSIERSDGDVTVTNRVGTDVSISALRRYDSGRLAAETSVERTLSPGSSTTVSAPADDGGGDPVAVYDERPAADVTLEESRIYVEDVTTNVIFTTDFDPADRGVESGDVEVRARLRGVEGTRVVALRRDSGTTLTGTLTFTLPLTRYLESHVLEFRTTTRADGDELDSGWLERDLRTHGAVVPLAWDLLTGDVTRASREAADRSETGTAARPDAFASADAPRGRPPGTDGERSPPTAGPPERTDTRPERRDDGRSESRDDAQSDDPDGYRRRPRRTDTRSTSSTTTEDTE